MKAKALKAWTKSLPVALGTPLFCSLLYVLTLGEPDLYVPYIFGCFLSIHFAAYLITGLPLFLLYHRNPDEMIWHPTVALLTGTILGGAITGIWSLERLPFLIGAAHGFVTAFAAWRQRPQHHENAHHLP